MKITNGGASWTEKRSKAFGNKQIAGKPRVPKSNCADMLGKTIDDEAELQRPGLQLEHSLVQEVRAGQGML